MSVANDPYPPLVGGDQYSEADYSLLPEEAIAEFLKGIGLDLRNEHLKDTPRRVARMWGEELFGKREPVTFTTFPSTTTGLILVRDIPVTAVCAHHLLPFIGKAHVAYIPNKLMCGISKIPRVIKYLCSTPQVQESLTEQIANQLEEYLNPIGVAVMIEAEHLCMTLRGVQAPGTTTTTTVLRGAFFEIGPTRHEFYSLLNRRQS